MREFADYIAPDDGRKFTELYNVQLMQSNRFDGVCGSLFPSLPSPNNTASSPKPIAASH